MDTCLFSELRRQAPSDGAGWSLQAPAPAEARPRPASRLKLLLRSAGSHPFSCPSLLRSRCYLHGNEKTLKLCGGARPSSAPPSPPGWLLLVAAALFSEESAAGPGGPWAGPSAGPRSLRRVRGPGAGGPGARPSRSCHPGPRRLARRTGSGAGSASGPWEMRATVPGGPLKEPEVLEPVTPGFGWLGSQARSGFEKLRAARGHPPWASAGRATRPVASSSSGGCCPSRVRVMGTVPPQGRACGGSAPCPRDAGALGGGSRPLPLPPLPPRLGAGGAAAGSRGRRGDPA